MINLATDLDGTLYKGDILIDNVKSTYEYLIENNINIFFITNNSTQSPEEVKRKLENLLDVEIDIKHIVTPLIVFNHFFKDEHKNIYIHGTQNLKNYLKSLNYKITSLDNSEIILIGRKEDIDMYEIKEIEKAVRDGKKIICFNKDITFPTENGEKPGNGAVVQIIEKDLGIVINSLGKPDDYYIKYFLDNNIHLDFVIGDRVDTDIFFGTKLNAKTILVNSGVSNFEDANNADIVIESFSKVVPFIF